MIAAAAVWLAFAGGPLRAEERALLEESVRLHLEGELAEAEAGYRELLDARGRYRPARLYLAQTLWLQGRRDDARRELAAAHSGTLLERWLSWRFGTSGPEPALEKIQRMYPFETQKFAATGTPALVLVALGEIDLAFEDYRRIALLDPEDATLHRQLGRAFFGARHALGAAEAYERVVAVRPRDAAALRNLGASFLLLQRWSSAIDAFERALDLGAEEADVLLAAGYAYERQSRFDAALDLYRRASALAPGDPKARLRMGRLHLATGELERAEELFTEASRLDPDRAETFRFLGELHLERGEPERAILALERAVALDAGYFEAFYSLARSYLRSGRRAEAERALDTYETLKREQRDVAPQDVVLGAVPRDSSR